MITFNKSNYYVENYELFELNSIILNSIIKVYIESGPQNAPIRKWKAICIQTLPLLPVSHPHNHLFISLKLLCFAISYQV